MEKKTTHAVIQSAYDPLGFAVSSRAVGAIKAKGDAMGGKMLTNNSVIELLAIVGLKRNEGKLKLH